MVCRNGIQTHTHIPLVRLAPHLGGWAESAERWRTHGKPFEDLRWAFAHAASERGSAADARIPGGTWPVPLVYIADEQAARP